MSRFLTILLGLIALGLLAFFCIKHHSPEIETDLVNRTQQALTQQDSTFATVSTDGRELVLTGQAPDQAAKDRAGEIARNVRGVRTVDNQLSIASVTAIAPTEAEVEPQTVESQPTAAPEEPEIYTDYIVQEPQPLDTQPAMSYPDALRPYRTEIFAEDGKITLKGHVADLSSKLWLVEKAKSTYGEENVIDELTVAYGAPQGWHTTAGAVLGYVGGLTNGKAILTDSELLLSGHAPSMRVAEQTKTDVQENIDVAFTSTLDIAADEVEPVPEYIVSEPQPLDGEPAMTMPDTATDYETKIGYSGGKVTLTGSVPDQSAHIWISELAQKQYGADNIDDQLSVRYGAPQGWHASARAALSQISVLNIGDATLSGQKLHVMGEAESDAIKRQVEQTIERAVTDYQTEYTISVPAPTEPEPVVAPMLSCQEKFNQELAGKKILFNTDEAIINPESYPLLNRLVDVAKACPKSALEIAGHTDDRGPEVYNQWLSEIRAKAVVSYLKEQGVTNTLNGVGYGELKPIADNSTPDGMAKNRRIEFNVQGN